MTPDKFFTRIIQSTSTVQEYHQTAQFYDSFLVVIKPISILVSIGLFAAAIYFIIATNWYVTRRNRIRDTMLKKGFPRRRATKVWKGIEQHLVQGDEKDWRIAIIEADKVLDEVLKTLGFPGTDLGDRLKRSNATQLPSIDQVWEAHKLRNRIAHEVDFKLTRELAGRAIAIYEQAFRELGALD